MKKNIVIISVVIFGFVMALSGNSWAQRERSGKRLNNGGKQFQKWDQPAVHQLKRAGGPAHLPADRNYRPVNRIKPKFNRGHNYRAPVRFGPKYRYWRPQFRRPFFKGRHHRPVINNYYGSTEGYAEPEEAFQASASVSDTGFSVSVGVSKTN